MESTLSLQLSDFREEVGQYLGYSRDYSAMTDSQKSQVDSVIKAGLRQFYHPQVLPDSPVAHKWSFLIPTATLATAANVDQYDFPDDFGSMNGDMNYAASDNVWWPIRRFGPGMILALKQTTTLLKGKPQRVAVMPKQTDGVMGQRFAALLWPMPDAAYTLTYRYNLLPSALSVVRPYPYGSGAHGETILESCLAVAESRLNDESGVHKAAFLERLSASIAVDVRDFRPDFLGKNLDRSDGDSYDRNDRHNQSGNYVTYNGTVWGN